MDIYQRAAYKLNGDPIRTAQAEEELLPEETDDEAEDELSAEAEGADELGEAVEAILENAAKEEE